MHDMKLRKPPACNACKARRVICHPQPNGAPCPRCAEKDIQCTTTPLPRGRPRKNPVLESPESLAWANATQNMVSRESLSSWTTLRSPQVTNMMSECPDLTPSLVEHLFHCFDRTSQSGSPILTATSIRIIIRTVSFQLHLLPPQSKVLALCIIAFASLFSFHEVIIGEGPRPKSISDQAFFSSERDALSCGARRSTAYNALHLEALRAAWDSGAMLQVSIENAATCFLLDVLEQLDSPGPSRPWAAACISHLRALAPVWRTSALTSSDASHWSGFLMVEALIATGSRKPILFNRGDQVLLAGPEPPSAESLLGSLNSSTRHGGTDMFFQSLRPYLFHVTGVAQQLWETITGDHARLSPVSEGAVIQVLASLSIIHGILTHLLERADAALLTPGSNKTWPYPDDDRGFERNCAYAISLGFAIIALPLHHELEYRDRACSLHDGGHTQARMRLLRAQAREMAVLGVRAFARAIRYLPPLHFVQTTPSVVRDYARLALAEAEGALMVSPEQVQDLETFTGELVLLGYSFDLFSSPEYPALIDRLRAFVSSVPRVPEFIAPSDVLEDTFFPGDQIWFDCGLAEQASV
ncbi:hypothetical protein FB451DRAFT_1556320, partial [Mycena latifolia]